MHRRRRSTVSGGPGDELSPLDYYSGVVLEPGYGRHMALQRLVWKATGRGVNLPVATLERGPLAREYRFLLVRHKRA